MVPNNKKQKLIQELQDFIDDLKLKTGISTRTKNVDKREILSMFTELKIKIARYIEELTSEKMYCVKCKVEITNNAGILDENHNVICLECAKKMI